MCLVPLWEGQLWTQEDGRKAETDPSQCGSHAPAAGFSSQWPPPFTLCPGTLGPRGQTDWASLCHAPGVHFRWARCSSSPSVPRQQLQLRALGAHECAVKVRHPLGPPSHTPEGPPASAARPPGSRQLCLNHVLGCPVNQSQGHTQTPGSHRSPSGAGALVQPPPAHCPHSTVMHPTAYISGGLISPSSRHHGTGLSLPGPRSLLPRIPSPLDCDVGSLSTMRPGVCFPHRHRTLVSSPPAPWTQVLAAQLA